MAPDSVDITNPVAPALSRAQSINNGSVGEKPSGARAFRRSSTMQHAAQTVSHLHDAVARFPVPFDMLAGPDEHNGVSRTSSRADVHADADVAEQFRQASDAFKAGQGEYAYDKLSFETAKKALDPKMVLLRDKITFVISIATMFASAYWLGADKASFYRLYIALALLLFSARFAMYRASGLHYYMFDFCYAVNLGLVIALRYMRSPLAQKVLFAYNSGPLAWSIVAMRNSLVLHSMDKMVTLFMHWFPAVVSWTLRWYPDCNYRGTCDGTDSEVEAAAKEWETASWWELGLLPVIPYALWLVLYYLKLFVWSADRIKQRGYDTVYHWMTRNNRHPVTRLISRFSPRMQPVVYLAIHAMLCWLSFAMSWIWWHSFAAHTAFLVILSLESVWNGANFYFEVFAHRYIRALGLELKPMKPTKAQ